jgi:hypothetical protein
MEWHSCVQRSEVSERWHSNGSLVSFCCCCCCFVFKEEAFSNIPTGSCVCLCPLPVIIFFDLTGAEKDNSPGVINSAVSQALSDLHRAEAPIWTLPPTSLPGLGSSQRAFHAPFSAPNFPLCKGLKLPGVNPRILSCTLCLGHFMTNLCHCTPGGLGGRESPSGPWR